MHCTRLWLQYNCCSLNKHVVTQEIVRNVKYKIVVVLEPFGCHVKF